MIIRCARKSQHQGNRSNRVFRRGRRDWPSNRGKVADATPIAHTVMAQRTPRTAGFVREWPSWEPVLVTRWRSSQSNANRSLLQIPACREICMEFGQVTLQGVDCAAVPSRDSAVWTCEFPTRTSREFYRPEQAKLPGCNAPDVGRSLTDADYPKAALIGTPDDLATTSGFRDDPDSRLIGQKLR